MRNRLLLSIMDDTRIYLYTYSQHRRLHKAVGEEERCAMGPRTGD